jgi:NAD(P)-dependent dehydrogenase (short-subunit alcohol dehydrogenase family)
MNSTHVLITGATSGIGYELARQFAQAGKNLILVARLPERLAEVKAELVREFSIDVEVFVADLFDPGAAMTPPRLAARARRPRRPPHLRPAQRGYGGSRPPPTPHARAVQTSPPRPGH